MSVPSPWQPLLAILLFLAIPIPSYGQDVQLRDATIATLRDSPSDTLPGDVTGRLETFFQKLMQDSPEIAFFALFQGTPFNDKNEVIDKIVATSRKSVEQFGAYTSYEFSDSNFLGKKSLLVTYMTEMPKKVLRWRFYFYSPAGTEWTLANLKVDDMRNYLAVKPNTEPPPSDIQIEIEKFFVNLQSDRVKPALESILIGSSVPDYQNTIEEFSSLVNNTLAEYGRIHSYELFDRTQFGSRHILLTYFCYLDTEPLRWQFIYRQDAPGKWSLINLRFDDMLDEAVLID
ncbi:MAG: hypothetical protein AAF558_02950 [Verrucomicrobiota bacterium]